jgi:hypothetical protein
MKLYILGVDGSPHYPGFMGAEIDTKIPVKSFKPQHWTCLRARDYGSKEFRSLSIPKVNRLTQYASEWCNEALRKVQPHLRTVVTFENFFPARGKGGLNFISYLAMLYRDLYKQVNGDIMLIRPVDARLYLGQQLTEKRRGLTKDETVRLIDKMFAGGNHPVPEGPGDLHHSHEAKGYKKYEAITDATATVLYGAKVLNELSPQYWRGEPRKPLAEFLDG